jgi:hypothetical protein
MKNWLQKNIKNIIVTAFVIPILLVAFVSISHVTSFYGLSNPISWAAYLSIGIEIAALSALAAVSVNMGRFVYVPFFVVTFIQMIGNIFFSFTYIDETGQSFQDWVAMVGGLFENMGIEKTDLENQLESQKKKTKFWKKTSLGVGVAAAGTVMFAATGLWLPALTVVAVTEIAIIFTNREK